MLALVFWRMNKRRKMSRLESNKAPFSIGAIWIRRAYVCVDKETYKRTKYHSTDFLQLLFRSFISFHASTPTPTSFPRVDKISLMLKIWHTSLFYWFFSAALNIDWRMQLRVRKNTTMILYWTLARESWTQHTQKRRIGMLALTLIKIHTWTTEKGNTSIF